MKKPLFITTLLLISSIACHAQVKGGIPMNHGLTLGIVAIIAAYSAKLVADRQRQARKKAE